jgi:hypothetical protein
VALEATLGAVAVDADVAAAALVGAADFGKGGQDLGRDGMAPA